MLKRIRGLREFSRNEDGVFAVLFGLMAIVLVALAGSAIDYTMWMSARTAAQESTDAGVLAAAVSVATSEGDIRTIVAGFTTPRMAQWGGVDINSASYDAATRRVTAEVNGTIPTVFVQLVGVNTLPINARSVAERATNGQLELALVLDNTWSMSDTDGAGSTKLAALKNAANLLITTLWAEENENIRVGLVPYADYVNVGTTNRHQPWMSVAADSSTTSTPPPRTCEKRTTRQYCTNGPKQTCTRYRDGVAENYDCYPDKTCETRTVPEYEVCSGGGSPTTTVTTWFGCVESRRKTTIRLNDAEPFTPYIGIMQTKPTCMTPIVPLTNNEATLRAGINGMIVNNQGHMPKTYIPTGMLWGINVVSPPVPFDQGFAYDPANREPRKAIVLMTDGDNTLRYNGSGRHADFSSGTTGVTQKTQTDNDTLALCTYAKNNQIEVFTVAFGSILPASQTMLQNCATSLDHYFAATSSQDLADAFENIADRLRLVRIVQ